MADRDRDSAQRREGMERSARNIREDLQRAGKRDPGQEKAVQFVKDSVSRAETKEQRK